MTLRPKETPETDEVATEFVPAAFARKMERERDEAIAARKSSAADWLCQVEQANARVSRALRQVALAERERDEAREAVAKWESSFDAMERAGAEQARRADENREWALRAEQERDEARTELEMWRDGNILHEIHRDELEKVERERDEARRALDEEVADCPNCDNVGWYMVPDSEGQPTMEQCQWCYTVPNSRFNSLPNKEAAK